MNDQSPWDADAALGVLIVIVMFVSAISTGTIWLAVLCGLVLGVVVLALL